jgi:hypothetical protein
VAAEPVRQAFEQKRALAPTPRVEEAGEGAPHRVDVVPVDGRALEAVRRDNVGDALDRRVRGARRELGEAVVLAHEDHRERPQRGEVDRLDEDASLRRAVAEEDNRDRLLSAEPARERAPERERDVAADDAGRAEEPVVDVDEVHRAPEAAAETAVATHELGHDALERRALRDRVPVRAMVAVDRVVVRELAADADRDRLLADAQVHEAVHLARARELPDPLLEGPDPPHGAEKRDAEGGFERVRGRDLRHPRRPQAATVGEPTACCTAATIRSSLGIRYSSIGWL